MVTCQNEKSQLQNKEAAFRVLKAKLYEREWSRSARRSGPSCAATAWTIRLAARSGNYVLYPYQMVTRAAGVETGNVDAVLDGDPEEFVIGCSHKWRVPANGRNRYDRA